MSESTVDAEQQTSAGVYENKAETLKSPEKEVERWLAEISLAERVQKDWRKEAQDARDMFRSEGDHANQRFNIQYSNINTMLPALYSSRPTPDVRKRWSDKQDKTGAPLVAAQIIERNLSSSMDCYDFDGIMRSVVQTTLLTGRGLPRVRHKPTTSGRFVFNKVEAEVVPWREHVIGPCEFWEDCPWQAFRHMLSREQLTKLSPTLGPKLSLDHEVEGATPEEAMNTPDVFKRAKVWEIWERETGKVYWIAEGHKEEPIRVDDDPLELIDFWPVPKPYYYTETPDTMVPMVPAKIIKPLLSELEEITTRIQKITKVIKWRGFADPSLGIEELQLADDGQLVAVSENILQLVQSGGLEKHIWLMPIKDAVDVVVILNQQREVVKQLIFEVTGVSDVIRGATDPNETLGAQEMKANFGTLRIQDQQKMVQRMVRDTLRIKAELMCSEFSMSELMRNAGMKLPTMLDKQIAQQKVQEIQGQAQEGEPPPELPPQIEEILKQPAVEEVEAIIRNDLVRQYVIDIETDSTVQQDMRQVQGNMSAFLEGTASFLQAIGPLVAQGFLPADMAVDLYQPFARSFHLGKQAEDALERMSDAVGDQKDNPQDQGPDPAQVELEIKTKLAEIEQAAKQSEIEAKQKLAELELSIKQQSAQLDEQVANMEAEHKSQMLNMEYGHKERMMSLAERAAENKASQRTQQQGAGQ